ncbi:hypothetical protein LCGC14_1086300 [marine sediment metagenome]|uniref:Uncharacterized protein n=1 Tax=marine sediment metagenome TaxID=412755 RepID=A0A0F9MI53_9ZZZZ
MAKTKPLTTLTFRVEGSDDGRLELDILPELVAYKRLVVETAKGLWRKANPDRDRLPKGFESGIRLQMTGPLKRESTAVPIVREYVEEEALPFVLEVDDEVDDAADLIEESIVAAAAGSTMPRRIPRSVIPMFKNLGASLGRGDSISLKSARRDEPALFTADVRETLCRWTPPTYEDSIQIVGEVTEADVVGRHFRVALPNDTRVQGEFTPEHERKVTSALHKHDRVRVAITGVGQYSSDEASLLRITRIDTLTPIETTEEAYDSGAPPVWKTLADLGRSVPAEAWEGIPTDLAEHFDRYASDLDEPD